MLNQLSVALPRIVATLFLQSITVDTVELVDETFQLTPETSSGGFKRNFSFSYIGPGKIATMHFVDVLNGLCKGGAVSGVMQTGGTVLFTASKL